MRESVKLVLGVLHHTQWKSVGVISHEITVLKRGEEYVKDEGYSPFLSWGAIYNVLGLLELKGFARTRFRDPTEEEERTRHVMEVLLTENGLRGRQSSQQEIPVGGLLAS